MTRIIKKTVMSNATQNNDYPNIISSMPDAISGKITLGDAILSEDMIDQMWARLYERPVIVHCPWCNSGNTFDSGNCVQCGGAI